MSSLQLKPGMPTILARPCVFARQAFQGWKVRAACAKVPRCVALLELAYSLGTVVLVDEDFVADPWHSAGRACCRWLLPVAV